MSMPAKIPDRLRRRIFKARSAIRAGLVTKRQLESSAWRRIFRGIYSDAALEPTNRVRAQAAALLLPEGGAVTGLAAAAFHGVDLGEPNQPVDVLVPPGTQLRIAGIRTRQTPLAPDEVAVHGLVRVATPARTAWDVAATLPIMESVPVLDALLHARLVTPSELAEQLRRRQGERGCRMAKRALLLADARAESPPESQMRVILVLAGFKIAVQHVLTDANGHFIARLDLALEELRIAIEYDGVWHANATQLRRDRARLNKILAQGWLVFHTTARDLDHPPGLIKRLQEFIAQRSV